MNKYIEVDTLIRKYIDTDIKKFSNSDVKIVLENLKQNILKSPSIEPCEDAISREAVKEEIRKPTWKIANKGELIAMINFIPSVEPSRPQGEWIPCSERLPEETGRYLCTVGAPYRNPREMYYAPQEWADKSDNATWRSTDGNYVFDWFVEAWQPLPKPWKGADDE